MSPKQMLIETIKCWSLAILFVTGVIFGGSEYFMPYSQLIGVCCFFLMLPLANSVK